MAVRNPGDQPLAGRRTATPAGHPGVGAAFIHEHQLRRGFPSQRLMPTRSFCGHVGTVLLGGVQRFFYTSSPAAVAINPPSKSERGGRGASPVRPGWHRVARPPVVAGGLSGAGSTGFCARTGEFGVAVCRVPSTAAGHRRCHAAIKVNMPLDMPKMEWLLAELARTKYPMSCPHGRPVVLRYSVGIFEGLQEDLGSCGWRVAQSWRISNSGTAWNLHVEGAPYLPVLGRCGSSHRRESHRV